MSNHTPGPWYARKSVPGQTYEDNYISIVNIPEGRLSDHQGAWLIAEIDAEHPVDQANAYLIAAAPDMLEALEHVAKALDEVGVLDEAIVLTAIRKAKGESCTAR